MMRSLILLLFAATLSFGQILSGVVISKSAIPASGPVLNNTAQTSGKTWSDIVTSTTFTIWVALQIVAECVADDTGLNVNALLTDIDTARFALPYCKTSAGTTSICAHISTGTDYKICTPITQAAPHVVMVRRDATHLILSLDNGAEQSIATGTTDNLTGGVTLMINFGPTYWP